MRATVVFLFVRRPDGGPTGYPMTGMVRDGSIEFTTYRKAAKARYLLADDRVCCVVPGEDGAFDEVVWGRARPAAPETLGLGSPPDASAPVEISGAVLDGVREALASGKRMVFHVEIERRRRVAR